jgi:hypothetical protein
MFSSRKPLAIALTLVILLAMLVPAAMAAPEWTHGVTLTSPTTAAPAYVNPEKVDANKKPIATEIKYSIAIVGLQVDDVTVSIQLKQHYMPDWGNVVRQSVFTIPAADLATGDNAKTAKFWISDFAKGDGTPIPFPGWEIEDGWYDLKICAQDQDEGTDLFCDTQPNAVLVQDSGPSVDLEKPGVEEWQGATFVTGKAYLLVGTAKDDWGIKSVEFQYCDWSNNPTHCNMSDPGWIKIADGTPTPNIANQWEARWDSTLVPNDFGAIRMCVTNLVGLSNCGTGPDHFIGRPDAHLVFVTNRFVIDLEPGWNLVSLPAMPYDSAITSVLSHLIVKNTVKQVQTWTPGTGWTIWTAGAGPKTLTKMVDGQGYWIEMAAEDELDTVGTYLAFPPYTPPEYPVTTGWNLVGYTQWGRPWWLPATQAADYLSMSVAMNAQSMWMYDANYEIFVQQQMLDPMVPGAGYWLAMSQPGTVRP